MLPISETIACNKIEIDYTMPDGSVKSIKTMVMESNREEVDAETYKTF